MVWTVSWRQEILMRHQIEQYRLIMNLNSQYYIELQLTVNKSVLFNLDIIYKHSIYTPEIFNNAVFIRRA